MESLSPVRTGRIPAARRAGADDGTAQHRDLGPGAPPPGRSYLNPVLVGPGGPPCVLDHLGTYLLYRGEPTGVHAYRSRDLVSWEQVGRVLATGPAAGPPEVTDVTVVDGWFVLMVTVAGQALQVRSRSEAGPFVPDPAVSPLPSARRARTCVDDDGRHWLLAAVPAQDGSGELDEVVVRLDAAGRPAAGAELTGRSTGEDRVGQVLARGGWYHRFRLHGTGPVLGAEHSPAPRGPWTAGSRPVLLPAPDDATALPAVVIGPDGATPFALCPGPTGVGLHPLRWGGDGPRIGAGPDLPGRLTAGVQARPPEPTVDPAVPHRHLRAWVEGGTAALAGVEVRLPRRPALLTAGTDGRTLVVRLDGARVAGPTATDVSWTGPQPLVVRGGCVHHAVTTSRLDDPAPVLLDPGRTHRWDWGGDRPVTAELAVRGRVTLRLGRHERHLDTVDLNGGNGFAVVVLTAPDGADALAVTAHSDAEVADVVLATRP